MSAITKTALVIAMAWAAGFVDAAGWVMFYHVYLSHVTGNTARLAYALSLARFADAAHHGWPIGLFAVGLLFGSTLSQCLHRLGCDRVVSIALSLELLLLASAILSGHRPLFQTSILSAAMGIQTVTITRVDGLRVFTTYLTGNLTKCAEGCVTFAAWFIDRTHGRFLARLGKVLAVSLRQRSLHHILITGGLWIGFFTGAVCGARSATLWGLISLTVPMVVLVTGVVADYFQPISPSDEPAERFSAH